MVPPGTTARGPPLKILVLGEAEAGKTAFIRQLAHGRFVAGYAATSGVDFYLHELRVDGTAVQLQLWDVAGRESARGRLAKVYAADSRGALIVYDITRPETFDTVVAWKTDLDAKARRSDGAPLPCVLVGTKHDLETAQADEDALTRFCEDHGFAGWFDVSAKTGYNVDRAVAFLVERILVPDAAVSDPSGSYYSCAVQ